MVRNAARLPNANGGVKGAKSHHEVAIPQGYRGHINNHWRFVTMEFLDISLSYRTVLWFYDTCIYCSIRPRHGCLNSPVYTPRNKKPATLLRVLLKLLVSYSTRRRSHDI